MRPWNGHAPEVPTSWSGWSSCHAVGVKPLLPPTEAVKPDGRRTKPNAQEATSLLIEQAVARENAIHGIQARAAEQRAVPALTG